MLETIGIILSYVVIFYGGYVWGWNRGWNEGITSKVKYPEKDPNESHPCHIPTDNLRK